MSATNHLQQGKERAVLFTCGLLAISFPIPVWPGIGVVNVNQHRTLEDSGCDQTQAPAWDWGECSFGDSLPFTQIASQGANVDAFSYHVRAFDPGAPGGPVVPLQGMFCQAVCDYEFAVRPKIISTDFGPAALSTVSDWLRVVCNDATIDSGGRRGRLHFEHWENSLTLAGKNGQCVGAFDNWAQTAKDIINLYDDTGLSCSTQLDPNGVLYHPAGTNKLKWAKTGKFDDRVTLVGFGFMGAIAMGDRIDSALYFRDLRWKRANLTRVWAVEQWTTLAPNSCTEQDEGPTPFAGAFGPNGYRLNEPNADFYSKLREVVQAAADRGIVVQLSVFDKHGLLDMPLACQAGGFDESPYNAALNDDPLNRFSSGGACSCPQVAGDRTELLACVPPSAFSATSSEDLHFPYLARVSREVGAIGNTMFEIVNEAELSDWANSQQWQIGISNFMKQNLPVIVVRDAFNQYSGGSPSLKTPDTQQNTGDSWTSTNATVAFSTETRTNLLMGHVVPSTSGAMAGSLPFAAPGVWTDLHVRGTVTAGSDYLNLGVTTTQNHVLFVRVDPTSGQLLLYKIGSGGLVETLLASANLPDASEEHTIRLRVFRSTQGLYSTEVIVDGSVVPQLSVQVGEFLGVVAKAYFGSSINYSLAPALDNFEAAYFCASPTQCGSAGEGL